jgi:hypothetical protein
MSKIRTIFGVLLLGLVFTVVFGLMMNSNAWSKTPDGQTPAVETVCDGEVGAAKGLCNAYCEAMDCDAEPKASQEACDSVLANFQSKTDGRFPPCDPRCNNPGTCNDFFACNEGSACTDPICVITTANGPDGPGVCVEGLTPCVGLDRCAVQDDCDEGSTCIDATCCAGSVCVTQDDECTSPAQNAGENAAFSSQSIGGSQTIGGN